MIGLGDWIDETDKGFSIGIGDDEDEEQFLKDHADAVIVDMVAKTAGVMTEEVFDSILEKIFAATADQPKEISMSFYGTKEELAEFKKTLGNLIKDED